MAIQLLPILATFGKGAAAVGGVGLGALGLSNLFGGREREERAERFAPRLQELTSETAPRQFDPSQLPPLRMPDLGAYRQGLRQASAAERRGLETLRSELGSMYNLGEDPRARQLLEFNQQDIANRLAAFQQGTRTGFGEAAQFIEGQRAAIDPEARAAEVGRIYGAQGEAARRAIETTAADISTAGGADVVGIGAVDGEAADIADTIAASNQISADAARAGAQLQRDALEYLAAASQAAGAARQGELVNMAAMAQAEAQRQFMLSEMERTNRERAEMRAAELALRGREVELESDLLRQLAQADLSEAEARAQAENFWMREGGLAPVIIGQEQERQLLAQLPAVVERDLITSGIESRDSFVKTVEEMLADPRTANVLATEYGITNRSQAEDYWRENYNQGRSGGFISNIPVPFADGLTLGELGEFGEALRRFGERSANE